MSGSGHWKNALEKCKEKYGPVFTLWIVHKPFVFIADIKVARQAFNKTEFSGRSDGFLSKQFIT